MHNLYAKFVTFLDICKKFSNNLVNEQGNIPRRGVIPKFSDLEVIALSLTAETTGIDSENYLFSKLEENKLQIPNLISRRQFNDRRKQTAHLCENIRKQIATNINGSEQYLCIDSKPVEICKIARAKRAKMGKDDLEQSPSFGYCASQRC